MSLDVLGMAAAGYAGMQIAGADNAQFGWAIGTAAYKSLSSPPPSFESGKLADLKYTGSSFGVPWPRIWGDAVVGTQVIWCQKDADGNHLRTFTRSAGKKSGSTGTDTFATFAVAFCQGEMLLPDPDDPMDGSFVYRGHKVQQMWAGQELIYDRATSYNKYGFNFWNGTESQGVDATVSAVDGSTASAFRGLVGGSVKDMVVNDFGRTIPQMRARVKADALNLAHVFSDILRLSGIPASKIDVTALASVTPVCQGVVWDVQEAARGVVERLLMVENLDFVEADGLIKIVPRSSGTTYTIDENLLGASSGGQGFKIKRTKRRKDDLPTRISFTFIDPDADFQQNTVHSSRQVFGHTNEETIGSTLVISAANAQKFVDQELDRRWAERSTVDITLPLGALKFIPGDKLLVPYRGTTLRIRITNQRINPFGQIALTGAEEDPDVFYQVSTGSSGNAGTTPAPIVPSVFIAASLKEIIEEHQKLPGFYVAASGDSGWRGGQVYYKHSAATDYTSGPFIGSRCRFGSTTSTLATHSGGIGDLDTSNTVGVNVSASFATLDTVDDTAVEGGANWAWVGDEIVGFSTATLTGASQYTLSRILRRLRGSVGSGHASGERFLVADSSVSRVAVPESHVGDTYQVKVVSPGQALADVTAVDVVISPRTPTVTETQIAQVLSPVWISPSDITSLFTFDNTWRTITSLSGVPSSAKALLLFVEMAPVSGSASSIHLEVRPSSGASSYKLAGSASTGSPLSSTGFTKIGYQATAPVPSTFDYKAPSGLIEKVELVGYMATPS